MSTTSVAGTSGNIIRSIVAVLLIRTEEQLTDSEDRHEATHLRIGKRLRVNNSPNERAISTALIAVKQGIEATRTVAVIVIAMLQGIEVQAQIEAEVQQETGHRVGIRLARVIDLATREIAAVEIELAVAMSEAVRGIVASLRDPDPVPAARVQAAIEVLRASAVREGVAERVVRVVAVAEQEVRVVVVEVVAAVEDAEVAVVEDDCRRSLRVLSGCCIPYTRSASTNVRYAFRPYRTFCLI